MTSFQIWLGENFVPALSGAWALSALLLVLSAIAAWRLGRRLGRAPRPLIRFGFSLLGFLAGIGGILLFTSGLRAALPVVQQQNRMLGEPAPSLTFTHVETGEEGRLQDYAGNVVLVNVWATWCPPCREEMPDLEELQRAYGADGLVVLQISDEDAETVRRYLEEQPMTTVHGIAQPIPWPEFGRPTSYVVDRQGVLRQAMTGLRDYPFFERAVREHL